MAADRKGLDRERLTAIVALNLERFSTTLISEFQTCNKSPVFSRWHPFTRESGHRFQVVSNICIRRRTQGRREPKSAHFIQPRSSAQCRSPQCDVQRISSASLPSSHPTAPLVFISYAYDVAAENPRSEGVCRELLWRAKVTGPQWLAKLKPYFPIRALSNFPKKDIETDHILQMCNKTTNRLKRAFPRRGNPSHEHCALQGQAICSAMLENRRLNWVACLCGLDSLLNAQSLNSWATTCNTIL